MKLYEIFLRLSNLAAKHVQRAVICLLVTFITLGDAMGDPKIATASVAEKVADGRPWDVTITKPGIKLEMVLYPDGSGVSDNFFVSELKWRPTADGLCVKPTGLFPEHCVTLILQPNGYDGIEDDGEVHLEFRR
jgi:hypothetical protein